MRTKTGFALLALLASSAASGQDDASHQDVAPAPAEPRQAAIVPRAACGTISSGTHEYFFPAIRNKEVLAQTPYWISVEDCSYQGPGKATLTTAPMHGPPPRFVVLNQIVQGREVQVLGVYYTWTDPTSKPGDQDVFIFRYVSPYGTEVNHKLTATLGGDQLSKAAGNGGPGHVSTGDPISLETGNLFLSIPDYETTGPNKLSFTRYYNSAANAATFAVSLGSHWRSTYDLYLRIASASSVTAERADGQAVNFTSSAGLWTTDSDVDLKLTQAGSTWILTDSGDSVETYTNVSASEARLTSIQARSGYTWNLQYSGSQLISVIDSFNRMLSFTYQNALLQKLTTPDGLVLTYGYAASGVTAGTLDRLASVSYLTNPTTRQSYIYDSPNLPFALSGVIDENGSRYATWTYDLFGRPLTSKNGTDADLTTIAYDDSNGSRTVTNALGQQEVYKFTTLQGVPKLTEIDRLPSATTAAANRKFTYDANGYTASQTDWNGNLTAYTNDAHGQPTSITEAVGTPQARTTTITYHPVFRVPAKIVEPGLTTTFTYDASGNLLTKTQTDTTTTTVPFSTNGVSRTWTYTWANGLLTSVKGPRTDVSELTKFTYDNTGALTATTNALGHVTQVTRHTPGGLPQTVLDPNGVATEFAYDARLRLVARSVNTAAGPLTTSYSYDPAGNLLTTTLPDASATTNTYDAAHRLTGVTDLFGQSIAFTLDALGDRTRINVSDATGTVQSQHSTSFDVLGRMLKDTAGAGQTTSYSYDANGNAPTVTDPLQRVTQRTFDALNRRLKLTDPADGATTASYDGRNRPTNVTDPNGATTTYVYDGFGDVIQQMSPDTGTTVYRYDLAGNLTQSVDATGAVANYTYDALDRAIKTAYPANAVENVTYSYDQARHGFGIGKLTAVTDAAGTLSRSYDERGNMLNESRISGTATLLTSYRYDDADRVVSIMYPSGWTVTSSRDAMGRITAMTTLAPGADTAIPVISNIGYQPFGPVNALTFGNGITEVRSFDLDYRLSTLAAAGASPIQGLSYSYDAADSVLSIADVVTPENSQVFGYDSLDRLINANGGYGSLAYTYDSVGNRLSESLGGATRTTYAYAPRSNRLSAVTANGVTQSLDYTPMGSLASFGSGGGSVNRLAYNQAGRLATAMSASNSMAQYTYSAFGQRLVRSGTITGVTLFQYDKGGHLLEESDGQGSPQADYIYLGDRPVATLSPSTGQLYFLHNDLLGTPQVATDSNQTVVWSANYQPFGGLSSVPSLIVQDLRLPGQEFDFETGCTTTASVTISRAGEGIWKAIRLGW